MPHHRTLRPLLVLPFVLALACGGGGSPAPAVATPLPAGPLIRAFTPTAASTKEGGLSRLIWDVAGADRLTLDPGNVDVTGRTQFLVVAPGTTTYTLTAGSTQGTTTAKATVTVTPAPAAPVLECCTASPTALVAGQVTRLQWVAPTATSVRVDPGGLETVLANQLTLKPATTTTYTVTATNSRGTDQKRITIPVLPAGSKPEVQAFTASTDRVKAGEIVTLTWTVQGAERLRIEPGGLEVMANTACFVVPDANTTYRLVAGNGNGEVSAERAVTVSTPGRVQRFPHQQLLEDVRILAAPSMEGRMVESAGSARARTYLKSRMAALGLSPLGATFEQPWQRGGYNGVNLIGKLTGSTQPEKVIVIGGHYDHIGADARGLIRPGADDNASGAASVLALAAWFKTHPPAHTLVFSLFDGEEMGLHGSFAFTEQPPIPLSQVQLFVNFDMVSRADYGRIGVAGTSNRPNMRPLVLAAAADSPWPVEFGHEEYLKYSDQYPFYQKDIPYLWFFCVDHDDYHTWRDTYERISPDYFRTTVEIALGSVIALDQLSALPRTAPSLESALPRTAPTFPISPEAWKQAAFANR